MFKRVKTWEKDGCDCNVLFKNSSCPPSSSFRTGVFNVSESGGCGLVKRVIIHLFVPGFCKTEKIQFIVRDKFVQDLAFIVEGARVEKRQFQVL